MPEPDPEDSDLFSRLRALRQPSPAISTPSTPQKGASDLEARFKRLGSASPAATPEPSNDEIKRLAATEDIEIQTNVEDEKTLNELLNELGGAEEWDVGPEDEREAGKLIGEGRKELERVEKERNVMDGSGEGAGKKDEDEEDERAADEYLAKALAELDLERKDGLVAPDYASEPEEEDVEEDGAPPNLDLPSAPTDVPTPAATEDDPLAALGLPSVPDSLPASKPIKVVKTDLHAPKFTDEEIDSWCIICYDDATVKCKDCDGDLYCGSCWKEGHEGEGAPYGFRKHRAMRIEKTRKKKMLAA